jgi:hypothetical protein
MMAFIVDDWRENRQDIEDFSMIMDEIERDIRLDSMEIYSDKMRIINQINCIDQLLDADPLIRIDSEFCLDRIMFVDWPDYVLTGNEQLKNSKIISSGYNADLMIKIYEYYQWVEFHYLLIDPTITEVHELKEYFINRGFPPIENDKLTKSELDSLRELQMDTEFITRLEYLKYNRREELRVYNAMERKSKNILDMFRRSKF